MSPKSRHVERVLDWSNFLLGCTNCNSVKGDVDIADDDILWPDRHNTMLALEYTWGGFVRLAGGLGPELRRRGQALLDLVGLDRYRGQPGQQPAKRDARWEQREEVWAIAVKCRDDFELLDRSEEARNLVVQVAMGYGFFSVWFTVFGQHVDVRLALIDGFPGTATSCFDAGAALLNRPDTEL